jgi:hypothetical protein
MRSKCSHLLRASAVCTLLFAGPQSAMAYALNLFGPPGPTGYGEFYQSDQSPASDPSCTNCVDGGVASEFTGTDLEDAYNAWIASVLAHHGVVPGNFFGEDFDAPGWQHDMVFDSQEPPDNPPAPAIADDVTISNDLPGDALRAEEPAKADRTPGSSPAIDRLAWEARDEFDPDNGNEPEATIDFGNNTDFLGFYIFDASRTGTFNLLYSDGELFTLVNEPTSNQNSNDDGFYRFIGFVNTHPSAQIERFWITNAGSRYGIDEIEWGRGNEVPEPVTLVLLGLGLAGLAGLALSRRRHSGAWSPQARQPRIRATTGSGNAIA